MLKRTDGDISRLKALLFDDEQRFLNDIASQLEEVHLRAGSDAQLRASVARILSGALKDAEVEDHHGLANAMAPVVVATIRREIVNSRDEMVEALYPITGQLVSSYVSHAFKDLLAEVNQRLESGLSGRRLYLRAKSFLTGQSYRDLVLAELDSPRVEELFLVRRGSGEFVDHWQAPALASSEAAEEGGSREHLVSGFLTAITEFARDAFEADTTQLQTLDIQKHRIYLRASPAHLIAAKCRGRMPGNVERILDDIFRDILEHHGEVLAASQSEAADLYAVLPDFAERLQEEIEEQDERSGSGNMMAVGLLSVIVASLIGWLGWQAFVDWRLASVRQTVEQIVGSDAAFSGYPIQVKVAELGERVTLEGLAPSPEARDRLIGAIRNEVGAAEFDFSLAVLPTISLARDLRAQVAGVTGRMSEVEAHLGSTAAESRLDALAGEVGALATQMAELEASLENYPDAGALSGGLRQISELQQRSSALDDRVAELGRQGVAHGSELAALSQQARALDARTGRLDEEIASVDERAGTIGERAAGVEQGLANLADLTRDLDARIALAADRQALSRLSGELESARTRLADLLGRVDELGQAVRSRAASEDVAVVDTRLEGLDRRLTAMELARLTPRRRLGEWVQRNAIFFSGGTTYRDVGQATGKIDELAALLKAASVRIRVVGYTDSIGDAEANMRIASRRAETVADELLARDVDPDKVASVGRGDMMAVSSGTGTSNTNRRVAFEIGFDGE